MPKDYVSVEVDWSEIKGLHDDEWGEGYCLYAYVGPVTSDIHYIGHTTYSSIRQRKYGSHKKGVYNKIKIRTDLEKKHLRVFLGDLWRLGERARRSEKLLKQVESLLINRVNPCGNTMYTRSRKVARPGMKVDCLGEWHFHRTHFEDTRFEAEAIARSRH